MFWKYYHHAEILALRLKNCNPQQHQPLERTTGHACWRWHLFKGSLIADWTLFKSLLKNRLLFVNACQSVAAGIRMEHDQQRKTFWWTETGLKFTQVRPSAGPFCLDSTVTDPINHSGIENGELLRSLIVWSKSLNLLNSLGKITLTGSFSKRGVYWRTIPTPSHMYCMLK